MVNQVVLICVKVSNDDRTLCMVICSAVTYDLFMLDVNSPHYTPIYACQTFHQCPIRENAHGYFISHTITPKEAPNNTNFTISMEYAVTSQLGVGEIVVTLFDENLSHYYFDTVYLINTPVGNYSLDVVFGTTPHPGNPFISGNYTLFVDYGQDIGNLVDPDVFDEIDGRIFILPTPGESSESNESSEYQDSYSSYF